VQAVHLDDHPVIEQAQHHHAQDDQVPLSYAVAETAALVIETTTHLIHTVQPDDLTMADPATAERRMESRIPRLRMLLAKTVRTWGHTATPAHPRGIAAALIGNIQTGARAGESDPVMTALQLFRAFYARSPN
jgi:hypothetical protein